MISEISETLPHPQLQRRQKYHLGRGELVYHRYEIIYESIKHSVPSARNTLVIQVILTGPGLLSAPDYLFE